MRFPSLLSALLLLLGIPACDQAKNLLKKVPAAPSTATAKGGPAEVRHLEAAGFDSFVATPGRLMVVDFHADWCGPCKVLGPLLEQVAGEFGGKVSIGKVDIDQARELAQKEGVSSIPDVRLYREGKLVDKFVGAVDAEKIRSLFQQHTEGLQIAAVDKANPGQPAPAPVEPAIQPMKKGWLPPGVERR